MNHLKITQKMSEQHAGKARDQEATENSHTGHDTNSFASTDVKVQKM
jgi:hypothetical protein